MAPAPAPGGGRRVFRDAPRDEPGCELHRPGGSRTSMIGAVRIHPRPRMLPIRLYGEIGSPRLGCTSPQPRMSIHELVGCAALPRRTCLHESLQVR